MTNTPWIIPDHTQPQSQASEQNESQNASKRSDMNYLKKLITRTARKKISWNDNWNSVENIDFYNKITKSNYKLQDFVDDLTENLSWTDLRLALDLSDSEKEIFFIDFKNELDSIIIAYQNKKTSLKQIIAQKYLINQSQEKTIDDTIDLLKWDDLNKYIFSPLELEKFIESQIGNITKKDPDLLKKTTQIFEQNWFKSSAEFVHAIKKSIRSNPDLWKEEDVLVNLTSILNKIKEWKNIEFIEVKSLFSFGVFTDEQKKEFLKIYLPFISIKELLSIGLINDVKSKELKKQIVIDYLKKKNNSDVVDEESVEFKTLIESNDILVSTELYIESSNFSKLINSNQFINVVKDSFNNSLNELKEKITSKILTLNKFKEKILRDYKINSKITKWEDDINKMKNWIIFKFKQGNNDEYHFIEIIEFLDNWKIIYKDRSLNWKYNSTSSIDTKETTYQFFYDLLSQKDINDIELLEQLELREMIENWKIDENVDELWEPGKLEFSKYKEKLIDEIKKYEMWKTKEELEKDEKYKDLKRNLAKLDQEWAIDNIDVKDDLNLFLLESKINDLDSSGIEYGIKEWVSFKETEWEWQEFSIFTINHINKISKTIQIHNAVWQTEVMTFDQFYQAFKSKKWKVTRFTNNKEMSGLIDRVVGKLNLAELWKWFKIWNDNNIIKESNEKIKFNYLVQKKKATWKSDKLIKIYDVKWSWVNQMIKISLWEVKWKTEWKGKKEKKTEIYEEQTNPRYVSISFLENYIKEFDLEPKTIDEKGNREEKKTVKDDRKWSLVKWYLSNKSISEILWWITMWYKEFKEYLKWNTEEHTARVALSLWGNKLMPQEVRNDLRARVEKAEKSRMEAAVGRLGDIDTWLAMKLIFERLNTSNTEGYKKEAALMFMLQKYGNLYLKDPLKNKKWTFLWFRALSWWKWPVEDHPVYQEVLDECKIPDENGNTKNLTEEELVWKLIKKQCKEGWYMWVQRRSRLHKEVEKAKKDWAKAEMEDWNKKWKDTRNPTEQLKKWLDELRDLNPANAMWRVQAHINRWDSMVNMNKIPFLLMFSWLAQTMPEDLCNTLKWITMSWAIVPIIRFMSYPEDMSLVIETIRILGHKIEQKNPIYAWMWGMVDELYKNINDSTKSFPDRLDAVEKFYNKKLSNWQTFWDVITRALYMTADWSTQTDWDINSILLIDKDKWWKDNEILKKYYNKLIFYSVDWWKIPSDEFFGDAIGEAWLMSLDHTIIWQCLHQHTSGAYTLKKAWPIMIEQIKKEINAIKSGRKYSSDETKKTWLRHILKNLFMWLIEAHQTKLVSAVWLFKWDLKFMTTKRWVTLDRIVKAELTKDDIKDENPESKKILDEFVDNILNDRNPWDVSSRVDDILSWKIKEDKSN